MTFASEDKRVWLESEIMTEFEKIAKETNLLEGGPPEAFQPIQVADQPSWEDEDIPEPSKIVQDDKLASQSLQVMETIEKLAQELAEEGRVKAAYRLERTLAALKNIIEGV